MKHSYLFFVVLLLCGCHTSRHVQTHSHATNHSSDSAAVTAVAISHADSSASQHIITVADTDVDIHEVVELFDSAGKVTKRTTRLTKVQHRDSASNVRLSHETYMDSVVYAKIQHSNSSSVVQTDQTKKFKLGSITMELTSLLVLIVILVVVFIAGKKIWNRYR